jgi:hypothetical protein
VPASALPSQSTRTQSAASAQDAPVSPVPAVVTGSTLEVPDQVAPLKVATFPSALAGGAHIGPTGGVGLVIPPMPPWAVTAVIVGWIGGWLAIGAWKMTTRDA